MIIRDHTFLSAGIAFPVQRGALRPLLRSRHES